MLIKTKIRPRMGLLLNSWKLMHPKLCLELTSLKNKMLKKERKIIWIDVALARLKPSSCFLSPKMAQMSKTLIFRAAWPIKTIFLAWINSVIKSIQIWIMMNNGNRYFFHSSSSLILWPVAIDSLTTNAIFLDRKSPNESWAARLTEVLRCVKV